MKLSKLRWRVFGPDVFEVHPVNRYTFKVRPPSDKDKFYRWELSGSLTIGGRNYGDEFALMKVIDREPYRYAATGIRFEVFREGEWQVFWRGEFSGNDFSDVDDCACTLTVKPRPADGYNCILDNIDKELNIPGLPGEVSTFAPLFNTFEFFVQRAPAADPPTGVGWTVFHTENPGGLDEIVVWIREYVIAPCLGGIATPPTNGGFPWILIDDTCSTTGTAKYARFVDIGAAWFTGRVIDTGSCVDIDGELVAVPPPLPITKGVDVLTADLSTDLPVIVGAEKVVGAWLPGQLTQRQRYYIKHPRLGATYNWDVSPFIGVTIVSGDGTPEILVDWGEAPWGTMSVSCEEVNDCGTVSAVPLSVQKYGTLAAVGAGWPDQAAMYLPSETNIGDTFTVRIPFRNGEPGRPGYRATEWYVGVGGSIVAFDDFSCQVVCTAPSGSIEIKHTYDGVAVPATGIDVAIMAGLVTADPIQGPAEACLNNTVEFYTTEHAGWSYLWSTPPGWAILSGQGTARISVLLAGNVDADVSLSYVRPNEPQWILIADCTEDAPPLFWLYKQSDGEIYEHGHLLSAVSNAMLANICPAMPAEVSSDFFQWAPHNPSGTNYVNGAPADLQYLLLHCKGDVLLTTDTTPDVYEQTRKQTFTWAKLTTLWREMFNCFWFIDRTTLRLRVEHLKHFEDADVVVIDDAPCARFKYEREQLPRSERWAGATEARNADFVGLPIDYDIEGAPPRLKNPGVGTRTEEHSAGDIATDIPYIQVAANDEVARTGFVLTKNAVVDEADFDMQVIVEAGALTGMAMANAGLGFANLLRDWFTWGRPVSDGYINNVFTEFSGRNPNRREGFTVKRCADDLFTFDPYKRFQTRAGIGKLEEAELDFIDEKLTLQLAHQPPA